MMSINPQQPIHRKKPAVCAFTGLAGSPLSLVAKPSKTKLVLMHRCFNQHAGDRREKDTHCRCERLGERVPFATAQLLVEREFADWLLVWNAKKNDYTPSKLSIVARPNTGTTQLTNDQREEQQKDLREHRRDKKHEKIKAKTVERAKKVLKRLVAKGAISEQDAIDGLGIVFSDGTTGSIDPERFFSSTVLDALLPVMRHHWNNVLGREHLNAAKTDNWFMKDAPEGKGKIVSGGYGSEKVSRIWAIYDEQQKEGPERIWRRSTPGGTDPEQFVGGENEEGDMEATDNYSSPIRDSNFESQVQPNPTKTKNLGDRATP
jgi:hypothetical protein